MQLAQLTVSKKTQILALPEEFRFAKNSVYIHKLGDAVLLVPQDKRWEVFLNGLDRFSDNFMENGRYQGRI